MRSFHPALLLLLAPLSAWATTFYERPFPNVVKDAPLIVRGTVGPSFVDWGRDNDGARQLFTFYELAITEVFKGPPAGRSLVMRSLGGEKDGIGMQVSGAARFESGEDVVVLLSNKNNEGTYDIRGLMMGKFNIERGEDGKEYLAGAAISRSGHGHENDGQGEVQEEPKRWSVESLRQLIETQGDQNPASSQSVAVDAGGAPTATPALSEAAPQLQPVTPEEEKPQNPGFLARYRVALGVSGALALLILARKVRRRG